MTINGHIMEALLNLTPFVSLGLGIAGTFLATQAKYAAPQKKSWLGLVMIVLSILTKIALLVLQNRTLTL